MTTDRLMKGLLAVTAAGLWMNVGIYWMAESAPAAPSPGSAQMSDALPWAMGAKTVQQIEGGAHLQGTTIARGAFINLPVAGDVFSPARASLIADEVTVRRIPNSRNVDAELRGNVHLLYTVKHD